MWTSQKHLCWIFSGEVSLSEGEEDCVGRVEKPDSDQRIHQEEILKQVKCIHLQCLKSCELMLNDNPLKIVKDWALFVLRLCVESEPITFQIFP